MDSERAARAASPIPQPDQSSTAIVHRRPRGSQDAASAVPQGIEANAETGGHLGRFALVAESDAAGLLFAR